MVRRLNQAQMYRGSGGTLVRKPCRCDDGSIGYLVNHSGSTFCRCEKIIKMQINGQPVMAGYSRDIRNAKKGQKTDLGEVIISDDKGSLIQLDPLPNAPDLNDNRTHSGGLRDSGNLVNILDEDVNLDTGVKANATPMDIDPSGTLPIENETAQTESNGSGLDKLIKYASLYFLTKGLF